MIGVLTGVLVLVLGVDVASAAEPCPVLSLASCPPTTAPTSTTTVPATTTTTVAPTTAPTPTGPQAQAQLEGLVNAERVHAGLSPLTVRADVTEIASRWSDAMASAGTLSHDDAYFTSASHDRLDAAVLGENVARAGTIDQAHRALMASEHHRANILDARFTAIGVGATYVNGTWWLTEDFLQPRAVRSAPVAAPRGTVPRQAAHVRVAPSPSPSSAPVTTTTVTAGAVVVAAVATPAAVAVLPRVDEHVEPAHLVSAAVDGRRRPLVAVAFFLVVATAALTLSRFGRRVYLSA